MHGLLTEIQQFSLALPLVLESIFRCCWTAEYTQVPLTLCYQLATKLPYRHIAIVWEKQPVTASLLDYRPHKIPCVSFAKSFPVLLLPTWLHILRTSPCVRCRCWVSNQEGFFPPSLSCWSREIWCLGPWLYSCLTMWLFFRCSSRAAELLKGNERKATSLLLCFLSLPGSSFKLQFCSLLRCVTPLTALVSWFLHLYFGFSRVNLRSACGRLLKCKSHHLPGILRDGLCKDMLLQERGRN